jgi:sugar phosphate isomerase/epimerase
MSAITDLNKLCIHTLTTKPWSLRECVDGYTKAGVPGISVWRQAFEPQGVAESAKMLDDSGLAVVSLCRGGFFPAETAEGRQEALDDNRRAIDEAAAIGAPLVVLVCGAVPGMPLEEGRKQIQEGIAALLPHAEGAGVKLGIEPLHPVYSDSRSAVNTLAQANDMVAAIGSPSVGVTIDVYHCWWDAALESEIARAGDTILSFHMCDWRTPTTDILNDRGLMGDGCINNGQIRQWVEAAGFDGFHEVEVFSDTYWATDQAAYVEKIKEAYRAHG